MGTRQNKAWIESLRSLPFSGSYVLSRDSYKNKAAQELGRLGGLKGGKVHAEKLIEEQRSETARKAAKARWDKKRREGDSS